MSGGGTIVVRGVEVPAFLYGTAWKEERTEALVGQALATGFRGIDTANQRRHYDEAAVGAALAAACADGRFSYGDLFLQTKFTYLEGQDERLPYDPAADVATQVRQSVASSLDHLGVERLDGFLLHGPRSRAGLSADDHRAWRTFEELHGEGRLGLLGVSNVNAEQLVALCELAEVPPAFVQNRCFARLGWDREVRRVCRERGVAYQGFSLLTANRAAVSRPQVRAIAERHGVSAPQAVFRFALQVGMICLTGTTDAAHMREDLRLDFTLADEEVRAIEGIGG